MSRACGYVRGIMNTYFVVKSLRKSAIYKTKEQEEGLILKWILEKQIVKRLGGLKGGDH
jgi:hypothetical protein